MSSKITVANDDPFHKDTQIILLKLLLAQCLIEFERSINSNCILENEIRKVLGKEN